MTFDEKRAQVLAEFFPAALIPGIVARPFPLDHNIYEVIGALSDQIFTPFETLGAFSYPTVRHEQMRPLRQIFSQTHREQFVFYNRQEEVVGWFYGEMRDAMTFFMANSGVAPEYRQQGIYTAFLRRLLTYLAALGYERVVSCHQTNNTAVIIAKLKAGFNISGMVLDERWSAQVELTCLFHEDRRRGYEHAFSLEHVPAPVRYAA